MKKSNRQQVHYHAMLLCCCHDLLGSRLHQYLLHLHNAYLSPEPTLLLKVNKVSCQWFPKCNQGARKVQVMKFCRGILKKRVANGKSTTHVPHCMITKTPMLFINNIICPGGAAAHNHGLT